VNANLKTEQSNQQIAEIHELLRKNL